jgi:hypothetical protein
MTATMLSFAAAAALASGGTGPAARRGTPA